MAGGDFEYDVALSFAGEDRLYVERVAAACRALGVRVFYDEYETIGLWGKDLYEHLDWVYRKAARYCVLFISESYARKVWTNHERKSAQARALEENVEYVLPTRFDDAEVPGLRSTVGYVPLDTHPPEDLAEMIRQKVGEPQRRNFLPPDPDRLYAAMEVPDSDVDVQKLIKDQAEALFETFGRMTQDERQVVANVIRAGCAAELPENLHINVDLLARLVECPASEVLQILGQLKSLGIFAKYRPDTEHGSDELGEPSTLVEVEFHNMSTRAAGGNVTGVAATMLWGLCQEHGDIAMEHLDFAHLSSATVRPETVHD